MPVSVVTEAKVIETTPTDGLDTLHSRLVHNLPRLAYIRARRKPKGRGTRGGRPFPPLPRVVRFNVQPTDVATELVVAAIDSIVEAIELDADGQEWTGEVQLFDADDKLIEPVDVSIGAEEQPERPTRDGEVVAILAMMRTYAGDLAKQNVELAKSLASCGVAFKDVIQSVATTNGEEAKARYDYEWKVQESRERMHEHEVSEEGRVHRSTATKFFFGGIMEKYQPIFENLSRTYAHQQGAKAAERKPMPPRPSEDEVMRVFPIPPDDIDGRVAVDRYADIRSVALAMLRCKDPVERAGLQQQILVELNRLGSQLLVMQAEGERVLGVQRFGEVLAWYRSPWD